jgi:hypothetical protein
MRIEVTLPHEGIERGEYDIQDKRLKGLAEHLVRAGHAKVIEGNRADLVEDKPAQVPDMSEHNKVMEKMGRPTHKPTETQIEAYDTDLDTLRERYEALSGKRVYYGWDADTLRGKIAELEGHD